jgi:hypothetical protein
LVITYLVVPSNYYGHFCGILSHAKTIEIFTGCKQEIKINIYKLDWQRRRRKWNMKMANGKLCKCWRMPMYYMEVPMPNNGWMVGGELLFWQNKWT